MKYWGKTLAAGNLPAAPSLSITLSNLTTRTTLSAPAGLKKDVVYMNDAEVHDPKIVAHLQRLKRLTPESTSALKVETWNSFPTAAGLASSASGFAALTVAFDAAMDLGLDRAEQSRYARMASASAARSLYGGFVTLSGGTGAGLRSAPDAGTAEQLAPPDHWPLAVVVAICSSQRKAVSSSAGMEASRATSPFFEAWCSATFEHFDTAKQAVLDRNFDALAEVSEASCLGMHAVMLSTRPALIYWTPVTLAVINCVQTLRGNGIPVFFTIDAGPQVKAVCEAEAANRVAAALAEVPGVLEVLTATLGDGARVERTR